MAEKGSEKKIECGTQVFLELKFNMLLLLILVTCFFLCNFAIDNISCLHERLNTIHKHTNFYHFYLVAAIHVIKMAESRVYLALSKIM